MRFDLTVPLAKYVAMNYGSLTFPFRRYQMGKVYRGERPQKGRYREFYQCDIDIIGDGELNILNDAEIPSVIYTTFKDLGFEKFIIRINNRKVLNGFFEYLKLTDKITEILRLIDKYEKVEEKTIREWLKEIEISDEKIDKILEFINIKGNSVETIIKLKSLNIDSELFNEGILELEQVINAVKAFDVPEQNYIIDLKIARGLDYYTGTIYETMLTDYPELGSVCSGGRYDNLAEYYTNKKLPGVGISIGLSRLFTYLKMNNIISTKEASTAQVLIVPMIEDLSFAFKIASNLRNEGINSEVCYNRKTTKSMLNYANKLKIPYVIFIGEDEIKTNALTIKNMETGEQETGTIKDIIIKLK